MFFSTRDDYRVCSRLFLSQKNNTLGIFQAFQDPDFTDLTDFADELSGPTQGPLPSHPGMKYNARRP